MTRFGSICSGIEAASLAWEPIGWTAAWFAEIEKFPSAVLAERWPHVPNMGDMCQIPDMIRAKLIEAPPVVVGGTPCQAFSVAGARKGLADERGQLTIKFVETANAIDEQRPGDECVVVWENVPGVLSDKTNAFGCFLAALVGEDDPLEPAGKKWSNAGCVYGPQRTVAWRVLDAQYFGVAQRRRRVFLIASARNGFDPCKVLFESEGLRRDTPPSRETGSSVAALTANGVGTCGADDNQGQAGHLIPQHTTGAGFWQEGFGTLRARENDSHENLICMAHGQGGAEIRNDGEPSLTCNHEAPIVCGVLGQQSHGLTAEWRDASEDGTGRGTPVIAFKYHVSEKAGTMAESGILSPTLETHKPPGLATGLSVRRLTPTECERLQGMPDGHTDIPGAKDGPRYKAIGNSKAVPVVRWLGRRLEKELCRH